MLLVAAIAGATTSSDGFDSRLRDELARFEAARGGEATWVREDGPTPSARALAALLAGAAQKGLQQEDYGGRRWVERLAQGAERDPEARARLDTALSADALRYLSDLRYGRVDLRRQRVDVPKREPGVVAEALARIASASDVAAVLTAVEPSYPAYRRTLGALRTYQKLAADERREELPAPRRAVAVGDRYEHGERLSRRLELLGDLPAGTAAGAGDVYDAALAAAVARFQRRHGLEPHGRLDSDTTTRLAVPLSRRATQLALTLERWRWLPRELSSPPIVVNIPEFRLYADGGRLTMRVAVGKTWRWRTPVFAGELRRVVFRPSWNVPAAIQREELAPRIIEDPTALERGGYEVVDRAGRVVARTATPEALAQLRSGQVRLRQQPGPHNALGLVKFDLPNTHNVYLHGTPSREIFSRARRAVTHGCIRVEDPAALAAWTLRERGGWTEERIASAMNGADTRVVELPRPIPVFVLYGTAIVAPDGEVRFVDDVYGLDAALEHELAHQRRTRPVSTWMEPDAG